MGHTDIETTLNVYGHLIEEQRLKEMENARLASHVCSIIHVANLWQVLCNPQKYKPFR